jgi:hypothetical protein
LVWIQQYTAQQKKEIGPSVALVLASIQNHGKFIPSIVQRFQHESRMRAQHLCYRHPWHKRHALVRNLLHSCSNTPIGAYNSCSNTPIGAYKRDITTNDQTVQRFQHESGMQWGSNVCVTSAHDTCHMPFLGTHRVCVRTNRCIQSAILQQMAMSWLNLFFPKFNIAIKSRH